MEIEVHGFVIVVHNISTEEIKEVVSNFLHINYDLFKSNDFENKLTLTYSFNGSGESVSIRTGSAYYKGKYGYAKFNLHGSFFDNSPNFCLENFIGYMSNFDYKPKQLDIAINDNFERLKLDEIIKWCKFPDYYCIGSLVKREVPRTCYKGEKFDRIELGSAKSKSNYGTIYVRPDTNFIRFEIKYKNEEKINYLLENHNANNDNFEKKCLESLVSCINFIKPTSRGKRGHLKNVKLPSWKSFLETDINKMNWSQLKAERSAQRNLSDCLKFDKSLKRLAAMLQNLVKKSSFLLTEDEILNTFSNYSGYLTRKLT